MNLFKKLAAFVIALGLLGTLTVSGQNLAPQNRAPQLLGIIGSANTIVKFNSAADNFDDSILTDDGTDVFVPDDAALTFGASTDFYIEHVSATPATYMTAANDLAVFASTNFYILDSGGTQIYLAADGSVSDGASASYLEQILTVNTADGSDTYSMFRIGPTNANHTGTGNTLNLIELGAITGDAESNLNAIKIGALTGTTGSDSEIEAAINVAAGWDYDFLCVNGCNIASSGTIAIGNTNTGLVEFKANSATFIAMRDTTGNHMVEIIASNHALNNANGSAISIGVDHLDSFAMNGSDTQRIIHVGIDQADHTGTGNTLNFLEFDTFTGDANANLNAILIGALTGTAGAAGEVETAINIGDGWDYAIRIPDGAAGENELVFGTTGADVTMTWYDASGFFIDTTAAASANGNIKIDTDYTGTVEIRTESGANTGFTIDTWNATNAGFNYVDLDITQIAATDGSDVINMLHIDWNETDWATATEQWNAIHIDDITQDAQGAYWGVNIGSGLDGHFVLNSLTAAPVANPPDQHIAFYVDDNADYSGGGGNDCAFVARDDTGNETVIAILVTNGACP